MREAEFQEELKEKLQKRLENNKYEIKISENLIYKVIINENLRFEPDKPNNPTRGNYAFQTDLLIKEKNRQLPLVVIETKYGSFSTHDVITYSVKAQKHKDIYPYLRYGFVIGGVDIIHNRFFIHNTGFDFAFALKDINNNKLLDELIKIINEQIKNAEVILDILRNRNQVKSFSNKIVIKKLNDTPSD